MYLGKSVCIDMRSSIALASCPFDQALWHASAESFVLAPSVQSLDNEPERLQELLAIYLLEFRLLSV